MPGKRASRMLAVTALCALLCSSAGCGGSSSSPAKVSASGYVSSVCTALSGLVSSIKSRVAQIKQSAASGANTPAQGKAQIVSLFALAVADATRAINQVKAAGVPNISNGAQISSALLTGFTAIRTALVRTQAQASQLPITSAAAFQAAVRQLGPSLQLALASSLSGLQGLNSPALTSAANSSPACQRLKALEASSAGASGASGPSGASGSRGASGASGPAP